MKRMASITCATVWAVSFWAGPVWSVAPAGTAFTFQGQLKKAGVPVTGTAAITFSLWDDPTNGTRIGSALLNPSVDVVDGLFSVPLDFGTDAFAGSARWLEVAVAFPAGSSTTEVLVPRQPIRPAPYALRALNSDSSPWQTNGGNVYFDGGRVGIGTSTPKTALHNTGDYYGKGHFWLHAYEGDGRDGTVYIQARDDSGSSSISMKLRTQSSGNFVDAMSIAPTGGVGIGVLPPAEGLWVRGPGQPGFGGQFVVDSADTSGAANVGASVLFANYAPAQGRMLGMVGCFRESGDPTNWASYMTFETRAANNPSFERMRITSTGRVGIGTADPKAALHVGDVGNWNWTSGDGWGDFTIGDGSVGLGIGVATGGGGRGDVRLWARGGTERLYIGSPSDGVTLTIDDAKVGVGTTSPTRRLDVRSTGEAAGLSDWAAYFKDSDGSGAVWLAGDDGFGREYGIEATGEKAGGFFHDGNGLGEALLAYDDADDYQWGIWAKGKGSFAEGGGGYFTDDLGDETYVATGGWGIWGRGIAGGGDMMDTGSGAYAQLGFTGFTIIGNGTKSFVQNHPEDPQRVVVYAAPEGDEVGTYTRGSARLVNGEVRVSLGETFQWVTNPDIGLTAHLTPRGDCEGLFVASLSTKELVVRELRGGTSDVVFDYIVYGLRIGFEENAVVQEKRREAYIPSMAAVRERYEKYPELRKYNAMERFKRMNRAVGKTATVDLSAARALHDAVIEFDPAVQELPNLREEARAATVGGLPGRRRGGADSRPLAPERTREAVVARAETSITAQQEEIAALRGRLEHLEAMLADLTDDTQRGHD